MENVGIKMYAPLEDIKLNEQKSFEIIFLVNQY